MVRKRIYVGKKRRVVYTTRKEAERAKERARGTQVIIPIVKKIKGKKVKLYIVKNK